MEAALEAAVLEPREVHDHLDEALEAADIAPSQLDHVHVRPFAHLSQQVVERTRDQCNGREKLVGDVAEQAALGTVERCQVVDAVLVKVI